MPETMAERVAAQRRREFVGRAEEVAALRALLEGTRDGAVLFVSGPGGVGKTTLLGRYADLGRELGRLVVRLDARELPPIASAYLAEIATQCGIDPTEDPSQSIGGVGRLLLLVDTTERLTSLDRWLREELLPSLAADAVAVLAGRDPPSVAWRTDPGWSGLVQTIQLTNLTGRRAGPSSNVAGSRPRTTRTRSPSPAATPSPSPWWPTSPPRVARRRRRRSCVEWSTPSSATLVDTVPSPQHRRALEACAQVLTTTEPLLAELLDLPDAHEMFAWLRSLSIIETGPRGLYPHDIARDALGAELRWRASGAVRRDPPPGGRRLPAPVLRRAAGSAAAGARGVRLPAPRQPRPRPVRHRQRGVRDGPPRAGGHARHRRGAGPGRRHGRPSGGGGVGAARRVLDGPATGQHAPGPRTGRRDPRSGGHARPGPGRPRGPAAGTPPSTASAPCSEQRGGSTRARPPASSASGCSGRATRSSVRSSSSSPCTSSGTTCPPAGWPSPSSTTPTRTCGPTSARTPT